MHCAITLSCGTHAWIELAGYTASLLVFATFYMQTMIPLRIAAICSNVAFVVYACCDSLYPILLLHSVLLPLNVARIAQILRMKKLIDRAASDDSIIECLRPFLKHGRSRAGQAIFTRGDHADCLYVLISGSIRIEETDYMLEAGDLFGETGLFSDARQRMQTARARTDVEFLWLTQTELSQVCYQNPGLALYFLRRWANRSMADGERHRTLPQVYSNTISPTTVRAVMPNTSVSSACKQARLGALEFDRRAHSLLRLASDIFVQIT
jgi:CRP/FNR family transcriptional regulator, cyclic AMP receptor protein